MRNYLRAEIYKTLNRPYLLNFTGVLSLLAVLGNFLIYRVAPMNIPPFSIAFEMGITLLSVTIFVVIIFIEPIFYDEFRNNTMKNAIALGIDRKKIIASKTILEIAFGLTSFIIILAFYFGSAAIFSDLSNLDKGLVDRFLYSLIGVVPLAIGGVAFGNFIGLIANSDLMKGFGYVFGIVIVPKIVSFIGAIFNSDIIMTIGNEISIYNISQKIVSLETLNPENYIMEAFIKGIVYFILFTILTMKLFEKKDL